MKRLIILSLLVTFYSFSLTQPASAIFCANCSTIMQQIPQWVAEYGTNISSFGTQLNTWNTTLKLTILDPLGNAMIAISLLKQQTNTMNLVTGALGGNSLLISNPEQWIKNRGLNAVNISLSDLSKQQGIYGDSLFSSVVANFKDSNRDLQTTLTVINSSSIPKLVQNNLCGEAALTQVAKNDVEKSDGSFDPAELAARKREIWDSLCVGNPDTNLQLAQKLKQVDSQRPDIGGWDSWLALTGGDNPYNKSVQANLAINKKVEDTKSAARDDLNRGGGVASPTKCSPSSRVETAPNSDPILNISDALCRTPTLTNAGSAINASFQAAINAPLDRLLNSFGSGIIGTLSSLLAAKNTIGMLSNAFSSVTDGPTGGGERVNVSATVSSSSTPAQDLVDNPDGKKTIAAPTSKRLATYFNSLNKLEEADSGIRIEVSLAKGTVSQIRSCYEGLMSDFNIDQQYPGVGEALSYAASQTQKLDALLSKTATDASLIAVARRGVEEAQTIIDRSNSSEEISRVYEAFEEKVSNGTYPTDALSTERGGEYQTLKADNQIDSMEGGTAYRLQNQCAAIRVQLTPRETAGS